MSVTTWFAAVALVLAFVGAAFAAPAMPDRSPAKVVRSADVTQVRSAAAIEAEDEPSTCSKARRRLWIESEGWVVRKVTTCH